MRILSVNRAILACIAWRDLLKEFEFEHDPIEDDPYLTHQFFRYVVCEQVSSITGIRGETIFRQLVRMKDCNEDILCQAISDFLKSDPADRAGSDFAKLLTANLGIRDTERELQQELAKI